MVRPNVFIVGAPKCATSWLKLALQQHPDIGMLKEESYYFAKNYNNGYDWYLTQFADLPKCSIYGEKCNEYLTDDAAASRIASDIEDPRIIICIRNPVDRAYSAYCMRYRSGVWNKRPEAYLDPTLFSDTTPQPSINRGILYTGLYTQHIERWERCMQEGRVLTVLTDDIRHSPLRILKELYQHVGVDHSFVPTMLQQTVHNSTDEYSPPPRWLVSILQYLETVSPSTPRRLHKMSKIPLVRAIKNQLCQTRTPEYPQLSLQLKEKLIDFYRDDIKNLQEKLNRDLIHWLNA